MGYLFSGFQGAMFGTLCYKAGLSFPIMLLVVLIYALFGASAKYFEE